MRDEGRSGLKDHLRAEGHDDDEQAGETRLGEQQFTAALVGQNPADQILKGEPAQSLGAANDQRCKEKDRHQPIGADDVEGDADENDGQGQ